MPMLPLSSGPKGIDSDPCLSRPLCYPALANVHGQSGPVALWITLLMVLITAPCRAEPRMPAHADFDELMVDQNLSLHEIVDETFHHYPQQALIGAFEDEARALEQRSTSWIAGYPMIYLQYIDDALISDRGVSDIQSGYQVPVWMWGQKEASEKVTQQAALAVERYAKALRHEIAGLVRNTLWAIRVAEIRKDFAQNVHGVSEELLRIIQRRVELGDLAQTDLLLAESDALEKKTLLIHAEVDLLNARKAYQNLTRISRLPAQFEEHLASSGELDEHHPALAAASASVERAQAEVDFVRLSKQGNQPTILLGTDSTSVDRQRDYGTGTNLVFQIPIGGDDWHAPQVAQANVALNEKLAQRESLFRQLEKALHDAHRNLELDEKALEIANRRKHIAETQLKMSRVALEAGEIALIDFLKIQASAQAALRDALERAVLVQKDIATLNQVLGITP